MPPEPHKDHSKLSRKGKDRELDLADRIVAIQRKSAAYVLFIFIFVNLLILRPQFNSKS
jgi:hypothetical protein